MKDSIQEWIKTVLKEDEVKGKHVLEVGAMDVNGSVRPYIESLKPRGYWATDMRPGKGVDHVIDCEDLAETFGFHSYDIVISCEMLEHAKHWQICLARMFNILTWNGILILTTVMEGFPKHDFPEDLWRFDNKMLRQEIEMYAHRLQFAYDNDFGIFVKAYTKR